MGRFSEQDILNNIYDDDTKSFRVSRPKGAPDETVVNIGSSSTEVLAARPNRVYLQLINDSDSTIYISTSDAAGLNKGTRLNANGGAVVFDTYVPTSAIHAISTAANKKLLVTEG